MVMRVLDIRMASITFCILFSVAKIMLIPKKHFFPILDIYLKTLPTKTCKVQWKNKTNWSGNIGKIVNTMQVVGLGLGATVKAGTELSNQLMNIEIDTCIVENLLITSAKYCCVYKEYQESYNKYRSCWLNKTYRLDN